MWYKEIETSFCASKFYVNNCNLQSVDILKIARLLLTRFPNVKQAVSSQWEFPGHQKKRDKHYMKGNQAKTNK